jgi:hypothetical protein
VKPRFLGNASEHLTGARRVEEARQEGIAIGRRQVLPFEDLPCVRGVTTGTRYEPGRSRFDAYVAFERGAREDLRGIQRAGWAVGVLLAEPRSQAVAVDRIRQLWLLRVFRRFVDDQVRAAAEAVDAELEEGRGRRCVAEAMRHEPRRPAGVEELADLAPWVEDDPRRAIRGWPATRDAGGEDHGYHWRLEHPTRPWKASRWRISYLCLDDPTHEVYAIELLWPPREDGSTTGRVWVLGRLRDRGLLRAALKELEEHAMRERNSLISAALAVRAAMARDSAAWRCGTTSGGGA